jgi:hypothetical protein
MANENPLSGTVGYPKWPEEDVLTLLCSLNTNIDVVRKKFETDKKNGIEYAAELLSKTIGNCSSGRVKGKIEHLWRAAGPSNGIPSMSPDDDPSKSSDMIYRTGAWTWTLPSLDALHPGMLEKIASNGKAEQR